MAAALRAVRASLGADALILESRELGEESGGGVEITAVGESRVVAAPVRSAALPLASLAPQAVLVSGATPRNEPAPVSVFESEPQRQPPWQPPPVKQPAAPPAAQSESVREEIAALRSLIYWLAPNLNQNNQMLQALVRQGLSPENITRLSKKMQEVTGADEREKLMRALIELIPSGGRIEDAVDHIALIGPSGVGKTTNLVKLTVFENQRLQRKIGWINTDQRRLAGGDPLALYASILGVRYETAESNKELRRAFERLSSCDLVLVDTPGVNPRDEGAMKNLARLLHTLPQVRRMLVCSAATNGADLADWIKRYGRLGLNSLFFTKLDECRYLGPLINTALSAGHPLSYITLGQNLAGDLENATPEVLTSLLLTGSEDDD